MRNIQYLHRSIRPLQRAPAVLDPIRQLLTPLLDRHDLRVKIEDQT